MWLLGILLLWLIASAETNSSLNLCVVTNNPNFTAKSDYYYPIDVFYSDRIKDGVQLDPFVPCTIRKAIGNTTLSCPVHNLGCPMIESNIHSGLAKSMQWKKATSLCSLKSKLLNPAETVNIFVFGGSVTAGIDGDGCNELNPGQFMQCSWVHYLRHWMSSTMKATIKVHNFGKAGRTSEYSAETMKGHLRGRGSIQLSDSDIVFIDHSFNDATQCAPHRIRGLESGVEMLIRRLLQRANSTENLPTIILLNNFVGATDCHVKVYTTLAQHYGIRYYSFTDAIMSKESVEKQSMFRNHVTRLIVNTFHPPWYSYLFYADFFATLLQYELDICDRPPFNMDGNTSYVIPEPLMSPELNHTHLCNADLPPLLKISHHDIMSKTAIGDYFVPINNTWQLRLDRRGRGGFITELTSQTDLVTAHNSPIESTLNATVGEVLQLMKQSDVIMQVTYLRSYTNSGIVSAYALRQSFPRGQEMDALWPDYEEYRYTVPVTKTIA